LVLLDNETAVALPKFIFDFYNITEIADKYKGY